MFRSLYWGLIVCSAVFLNASRAGALEFVLPERIDEELISEAVPTAFEVAPFLEADFEIGWKKSAPPGVRLEIVPGSLTWVRVSRYLVLPRARVRIELPVETLAQVRIGRSIQAVTPEAPEVPVSLFSAEHELLLVERGKASTYSFHFRYSPKKQISGSRVFVDVSCSPQNVKIVGGESLPANQWVYLGCRMIRSTSHSKLVPQLELIVAWSGISGSPSVISGEAQVSSRTSKASLMSVLLSADKPSVQLHEPEGGSFEIQASLPKKLNRGSFGVGLGPYAYFLDISGDEGVSQAAALATLYGAYSLSENSRIIFFDAFPVHRRWYNDFGLYFDNESSRALDERLSVNLLLGFHWIAFRSPSGPQYRLGVPQGFEMLLRDAFGKRKNMSLGGFFFPLIDGKSYYNAWARVGTKQLFIEANYLSWTERLGNDGRAHARNFGICIGGPLFFF
ncbi:MAG: hypothetical protein KGQ59_04910 [Bdellovibrionales bacterium]|nr:hypothetical protein [Bdellovibrionales bacterium]